MQWEFSLVKRWVVDCCVGEFDMISLGPGAWESGGGSENLQTEDAMLTLFSVFHQEPFVLCIVHCLPDIIIYLYYYSRWHIVWLYLILISSVLLNFLVLPSISQPDQDRPQCGVGSQMSHSERQRDRGREGEELNLKTGKPTWSLWLRKGCKVFFS